MRCCSLHRHLHDRASLCVVWLRDTRPLDTTSTSIDIERTTALSSDSLIVWLCVELTNQLLFKLPSEDQDDAPSNEQVPALDNDMGIADWSVGTKYFGAEIRVRFLPTHVYRALTTQARRQLIARDSTRAMIVLFAPDVVRTRRSVVAVHRDRHSFD